MSFSIETKEPYSVQSPIIFDVPEQPIKETSLSKENRLAELDFKNQIIVYGRLESSGTPRDWVTYTIESDYILINKILIGGHIDGGVGNYYFGIVDGETGSVRQFFANRPFGPGDGFMDSIDFNPPLIIKKEKSGDYLWVYANSAGYDVLSCSLFMTSLNK